MRELVYDGETEKQHDADDLHRGERFAEQQHRHEHGHDGVDVAQQRRLLPRQRPDGGEIHAVRQTRVHEADDEQIHPPGRGHHARVKARCERDIRREHQNGREKLHERALERRNAGDILVEQDDSGVKHRGAHAEANAAHIRPAALHAARADDERDAERGHEKAEQLRARHPLMKQQRAQRRDEHGREVVAECGEGNGRVLVRLEQQHPVDAHGRARSQQQPERLFDLAQAQPPARDEKIQQQKHGREPRAAERELGRGDLDPAHEQADRAEHRHGHDQAQPRAAGAGRSGCRFHRRLREQKLRSSLAALPARVNARRVLFHGGLTRGADAVK